MSSLPPSENTPLWESAWPFIFTGEYPQDTNVVPNLGTNWWQYMLPAGPGQDESIAAAHSEVPLLPSNLAADVQVIDTSEGVGSLGKAQPRCAYCDQTFGRRQELRRHLNQVHKPRKICPFKPCPYNWVRPDKIKAHIIKVHRSKFCPKVLKQIRELRGKRVTKFLEGYDFEMRDTYLLHLPPLLEPSGGESEVYYLNECCGCLLERIGVASSEGVLETVEQMAEKMTGCTVTEDT